MAQVSQTYAIAFALAISIVALSMALQNSGRLNHRQADYYPRGLFNIHTRPWRQIHRLRRHR